MKKILNSLSLHKILMLAFIVRLLWLLSVAAVGGTVVTEDGEGYLALGDNILNKGRYEIEGQPHHFRSPGYPLLVSVGGLLGGAFVLRKLAGEDRVEHVLTLQALMDLPEKMIHYAQDDVLHLPALRDHLSAKLKSQGRLSWLREECDVLCSRQALASSSSVPKSTIFPDFMLASSGRAIS